MRRSDKKANIAEANRLAEEAFMKEREMMGIPSPVKEEAPESPEYAEGQPSFDIEGAINSIVADKLRGGIEEMSSSEITILFEADEFSLVVNCDVEVDEYPYYEPGGWNEPDEGSSGGLITKLVDGVILVHETDQEIKVTAEQLKPLERMVDDIINDGENLNDYFEKNTNEPDYDDYRDDDRFDRDAAAKEWGGMDEEINEIKRITKRLLGE